VASSNGSQPMAAPSPTMAENVGGITPTMV
jgi:hypothetical protein